MDGLGGFFTAFQVAFDPDGKKTDELMGKGGGDKGIPDAGHPGYQNGACLAHPRGCGLEPEGDQSANGGRVPIGGDPSQGYYAMASDPGAPPEPPMSTTGKSYYEYNHLTGKSTDPRGEPPDPAGPAGTGRDGWGNEY